MTAEEGNNPDQPLGTWFGIDGIIDFHEENPDDPDDDPPAAGALRAERKAA